MRRKVLKAAILVVAGLVCLMISGCVSASNQSKDQSEDFVLCKDPRPEICTQEYVPVYGYFSDGSHKVYGNACSACSDKQVVKYRVKSKP